MSETIHQRPTTISQYIHVYIHTPVRAHEYKYIHIYEDVYIYVKRKNTFGGKNEAHGL